MTTQGSIGPRGRRAWPAAAATLVLFVAVFLAIFAIGRAVTPDYTTGLFGQHLEDAVRLKAQLGTALLGLALIQLALALWMYGRLPGVARAPRRVRISHRVIGALAFLLSVPIAVHCITTYGIELTPTRAAVHALSGCFFYGAFAAKVLVVQWRETPKWLLPVLGGCLVVAVAVSWYAAALWYFNGFALP
ncbi:DUF6529 family protein [Actinospica robiniae]|uniref:DUF6529 family protein n=1 Tax=Actinospica robiniae TaxID=304901 RepID=UPI00040D65DA|nr:DUF6529 family protein [Actinospica robiniae]